jgi:hypothetical protein
MVPKGGAKVETRMHMLVEGIILIADLMVSAYTRVNVSWQSGTSVLNPQH